MEILQTWWLWSNFHDYPIDEAHHKEQIIEAHIGTRQHSTWANDWPDVFDGIIKGRQFSSTATAANNAWMNHFDKAEMHDLTDGAGHGIIVAADKLYMELTTANMSTTTAAVTCKVFYRLKKVTLSEFIGTAQSQIS